MPITVPPVSYTHLDVYKRQPLVQKAVKELAAAMPEMEVLGADANQQEALFLIDDTIYLHIQPCDSGWDYTLYDAASMKEMDGGQLDMPELSRMKAVLQICDDNDLDKDSVKYAPLSMIETLQEAAYQQMQAEASQMTASSQLPEVQEQTLDEYTMPDEQVSVLDMQEYGYLYDGMPVSYTHLRFFRRSDRRWQRTKLNALNRRLLRSARRSQSIRKSSRRWRYRKPRQKIWRSSRWCAHCV